MNEHAPNALIHSTSPYLLQHAYNPVQWQPWGEEALRKAKDEDKPLLISIGYSSCHWCHVMERESFENEQIAALMNQHFVCIKVDREERPDIDQVYMEAIQIMGLQGGWPLNVFATPDQKPFYGGTYFPPQNWLQLLGSIANAYVEHKDKLLESAASFGQSLNRSDLEKFGLEQREAEFSKSILQKFVEPLKEQFDHEEGGNARIPKFPMPTLWHFLLRANSALKDEIIHDHIHLTLQKMAFGGICDQLGGGFARYSTDGQWFVPHFEKMLYDNAQLVSLYADAYLVYGDNTFKEVIEGTIDFICREMMSKEGAFFSALNADSEGEEGRYYVWNYKELEALLGTHASLFLQYYHVRLNGNWEDGKNILFRTESVVQFAALNQLEVNEVQDALSTCHEILMKERGRRKAPGLDDKAILSWNAWMSIGLLDAYRVLNDSRYLNLALKNITFIERELVHDDSLFRTYSKGVSQMPAYLEDYATYIKLLITLHQVTLDEKWLKKALSWTEITLNKFFDDSERLFFYTAHDAERLVARKKDLFDDVIPSSNALMCENLRVLALLTDMKEYETLSSEMLGLVQPMIEADVQYMSFWASNYFFNISPSAEIAIIGSDFDVFRKNLERRYYPNKILAGGTESGNLPITYERSAIRGATTIYVCYNKTCKLPVHYVEEAMEMIEKE